MSEQQPSEKPAAVEQQQPQQGQQGQRFSRSNGQRQTYQKGSRTNSKPYNNYQGSNNRYNKNGYHHKSNRNSGMPNMQWAYGYNMAGQPMYPSYGYGYVPPMAQGYQAPSTSASPGESATSSLSTTPVSKKIEITNRSGEHVDLNAIHSQHVASTSTTVSPPAATEQEAPLNSAPTSSTKSPTPEPVKAEPTADELLKLSFLEQVRKRKEMLARQKAEEEAKLKAEEEAKKVPAPEVPAPVAEPEKTETPVESTPKKDEVEQQPDVISEEPVEVEVTEPAEVAEAVDVEQVEKNEPAEPVSSKQEEFSVPVEITNAEEKTVKETSETENEKPSESAETAKPLTFAEKLKLKKLAESKAKEAAEPTTSPVVQEQEENRAPSENENESHETEVQPEEKIAPEAEVETAVEGAEEEQSADASKKSEADEQENDEDIDDGRMTMTELLQKLDVIKPIEDIYEYKYPEEFEAPDDRFKKEKVKYTYGPTFLLQFKDKLDIRPDAEWKKNIASKIVIPPGTGRYGGKSRGDSKFGGGSGFKKSGSLRGMEGRSNSRSSSKRKSKRLGDDRKSNRSYTSRKDRERMAEFDEPKEEVAPLVPSANRWVPKSKLKKTEKKLAPDGVTELLDKEEAERKMKSLLNKLTLEKFDPISEDIIKIADQSKWESEGETLKVVIEQIFHKACDEPYWSSMYAQLCGKVVKDMDPEIKDDTNEGKTGPKLVLHYLVDRCHTEFEKGWTDKLPTNEDGTPLEPEMMSDEYYKMAAAKRRGLGLVRFIGFLYRSNLLTAKMMFECFRRLMKDLADSPTEETLESVIELLSTVGEQFEGDKLVQPNGALEGSTVLDQLYMMLDRIVEESNISSRLKFKLIDMKEMREKNWNSAKKDEGPKTIQQIHEEEAAKKAMEERERKMKSGSRSNSRRNNSMGNRSNSRREPPPMSKDNFISTRSSSLRHVQNAPKEETPAQKTAVNMFDALMGAESDDE